ncbi:MAG: zinc ribbon domain-containing protein [Clostridia bacterium]|nr:zinc ribbon domain-containing protein [Clostridia bacterium]
MNNIFRARAEGMRRYGFGPDAMCKIKVCNRCGAANDSSVHRCEECGAKLPRDTLFDLYKRSHPYCPLCDTVAADHARYCPRCGSEIKNIFNPKHKEE